MLEKAAFLHVSLLSTMIASFVLVRVRRSECSGLPRALVTCPLDVVIAGMELQSIQQESQTRLTVCLELLKYRTRTLEHGIFVVRLQLLFYQLHGHT
jgi:hypothetical protein